MESNKKEWNGTDATKKMKEEKEKKKSKIII